MEHVKNHFHAPLLRFRLLCGLQTVGDGMRFALLSDSKKGWAFLFLRTACQKISRKSCFARGIVGCCPTAVRLRGSYLSAACSPHPARLNQSFRVLRVDLGPAALGPSCREPLPPRCVVMGLLLAVDPAKAERLIQRFGIGDRGFS